MASLIIVNSYLMIAYIKFVVPMDIVTLTICSTITKMQLLPEKRLREIGPKLRVSKSLSGVRTSTKGTLSSRNRRNSLSGKAFGCRI